MMRLPHPIYWRFPVSLIRYMNIFVINDVVNGRSLSSLQALRVFIYVQDPVMDLKCCVYNKLYRTLLVLRNRGTTALKVQTRVPSGLRDGVVDFHPSMGFVQGKGLY